MQNSDILLASLALLSESLDINDNGDFEERAPYIIAMLIGELGSLDAALRSYLGERASSGYDTVYASLYDDCPLLERFLAPASLYLASELIADESAKRSEELFAMYCDSVSRIAAGICGKSEKIKDKYFTD